MPQVPFLPVPLPQQVSFPADLASLLPAGVQLPGLGAKPTPAAAGAPAAVAPGPAAAAAPAATGLSPVLLPVAGLP